MGKSTISMAIFNSYVNLPDGTHEKIGIFMEHRGIVEIYWDHGKNHS